MNLVLNSSGKVIGVSYVDNRKIVIDNFTKPFLVINDEKLAFRILSKEESAIEDLFDVHHLLIGEIASLYGTNYSNMNAKIKDLAVSGVIKTKPKAGRRNSSFGKTFSTERREHIGIGGKGKHSHSSPYVMTAEIRYKIRASLKSGYASGRICVNREGLSKAWKDGKYATAKMGRGIQGFFESKKHTKNKDVYFRSLLELNFLLKIEEAPEIKSFTWEPCCISIGNGHHYTPDCLIGKTLIELKPRNHLNYTKDGVGGRFEQEVDAATVYCKEHGLDFKIIYDDEIGFVSNRFKTYLLDHPEIIEKYNIRFKIPLARS